MILAPRSFDKKVLVQQICQAQACTAPATEHVEIPIDDDHVAVIAVCKFCVSKFHAKKAAKQPGQRVVERDGQAAALMSSTPAVGPARGERQRQ